MGKTYRNDRRDQESEAATPTLPPGAPDAEAEAFEAAVAATDEWRARRAHLVMMVRSAGK